MARIRRFRRRDLLSRPRGGITLGIHYDPEAFGQFSETIARLLGTARFLVIQTGAIVVWIVFNSTMLKNLRFDKYPFILLTLALSLQAAYAAPLILLAQNRQADRDRVQSERDRQTSERTQAEAEFLARELASLRIQASDVVTTEDLDRAVERITATLERHHRQDTYDSPSAGSDARSVGGDTRSDDGPVERS